MMPPKDMSPTELWVALQESPRAHRIVDFPRKRADGQAIGQVAIWVLLQREQIAATVAAEKLLRAELGDAANKDSIGYRNAYENAVVIEILMRACRAVNDLERPAFPSAKDLRAHVTTDEAAALFEAYLDVAQQVGPIIGDLTKEQADAWIDVLIDGGSNLDPLGFCSSGVLRTLLRTSVERLASSRAGTSSVGSPDASTREDSL